MPIILYPHCKFVPLLVFLRKFWGRKKGEVGAYDRTVGSRVNENRTKRYTRVFLLDSKLFYLLLLKVIIQ